MFVMGHDFSMTVQKLSDFFVLPLNNIDYRVYFVGIDKKAALYF